MYGDLFGDLPAAKGSSSNKNDEKSSQTSQPAAQDDTQAAAPVARPSETATTITTTTSDAKKTPDPFGMMLMPPVARKKAKTGPSSISKSIGTAGTSMAFIPTKVRKRPNRVAANPPQTSNSTTTTIASIPTIGGVKTGSSISAPNPTSVSSSSFSQFSTSATTTTTKLQSSRTSAVQAAPIDIHASTTSQNESTTQLLESEKIHPTLVAPHSIPHDVEEEEITDPYDPRVPNDLLQYRDLQRIQQERRQAEEEAQQALEDQRLLREQLERERHAMEDSGDFSKLAFVAAMGRGRGRGLSNLPAWLVAKQQQQQQEQGEDLGSNP